MQEELTKDGFLNAWNGVPGYSLEPYMNYCRKTIRTWMPRNSTPRWLGTIDEIVDSCLTDVLQTVFEKIDQFDKDKGDFTTFLSNYCRHAYSTYLRKQKGFSKCQSFEDGITGLLKTTNHMYKGDDGEGYAPDTPQELTVKDPHRLYAEEEVDSFKKDIIKKILKIVSGFNARDKEIFEAAYPAILNIKEENIDDICPMLEEANPHERVVKYICEKMGIEPGTVRTILSRLRERVRTELWRSYQLDAAAFSRGTYIGFEQEQEPQLTQEEIDSLTDDECLLIWALMSLKDQLI